MENEQEIERYIKHYEIELQTCSELLRFLESQEEVVKKETAKEDILIVKQNVKFISFFTAFFLDMASSIRGFYQSRTAWEVKYHMKAGITCLYEALKKIDKYQKDVREDIHINHEEYIDVYENIREDIRAFKRKYSYDKSISTFRNTAGAHYDLNFLTYYESLQSVNSNEKVIMLIDFSNILMNLINLYSDIIEQEYKAILRE